MAVPRQVVVDDTDPSITFNGNWVRDQGLSGIASVEDDRLGGPAYNDTSTFADIDLSLSFTFTGTQFSLFGGINFMPTGTFGICYVDNIAVSNANALINGTGIVGTNNNLLCADDGLSDGTHLVTFQVGGIGSFQPAPGADGVPNRVWVDRIVYSPSASVALDTVPAVMITPGDPLLEYSAGWQTDIYDSAQVTSEPSGSVMFTFHGTSVAYYGMLLNNFTLSSPSSATYSIDGQPPSAFSVVDFLTGTMPNNTPFFSSGKLAPGQHILTVVNQGNTTVAPLSLRYLIVQPSAGFDNITGTVTPPGTGTSSSSDSDIPTKHFSTAKIIGAVVGIVGGLLLILSLLLFLRRRSQLRRRRSRKWATRFRSTLFQREPENLDTIPLPEVHSPSAIPKQNDKEMAEVVP